MRCNLCMAFTAALFAICLPLLAVADPLPGRDVLKFSQQPMLNTTLIGPNGGSEVFHGHDELSTAWGFRDPLGTQPPTVFQGTFMADDFADHFNSPVVHLKWWGSYLNRPTSQPDARVRRFLISFEEDVPVGPNNPLNFSHPGKPLLNQIVSFDPTDGLFPAPGTFKERPVAPISIDGPIYEYNAELHLDKVFPQEAEKVYWLKIVALDEIDGPNVPLPLRLQWGWHNRDYTKMNPLASTPVDGVVPGEHIDGFLPQPGGEVPIWHFQDDAVSGNVAVIIDPNMPIMPRVEQGGFEPQRYQPPWDGPTPIANFSKDLAFELYTVPEPGSAALAVIALVGCGWAGRRRRN